MKTVTIDPDHVKLKLSPSVLAVCIGTTATIVAAVLGAWFDLRSELKSLRSDSAKYVTIDEAQIWTDTARSLNRSKFPDFQFPDPLDVRGKKELRRLKGEIEVLLQKPSLVKAQHE